MAFKHCLVGILVRASPADTFSLTPSNGASFVFSSSGVLCCVITAVVQVLMGLPRVLATALILVFLDLSGFYACNSNVTAPLRDESAKIQSVSEGH